MPAAVPAILAASAALTAAGTAATLVTSNQERQHAKGAAQAQETAMQDQIAKANAMDQEQKDQRAKAGSGSQSAALAAVRAALSTNSAMGGTILTGPQGTGAPAPTASKTLLGA